MNLYFMKTRKSNSKYISFEVYILEENIIDILTIIATPTAHSLPGPRTERTVFEYYTPKPFTVHGHLHVEVYFMQKLCIFLTKSHSKNTLNISNIVLILIN